MSLNYGNVIVIPSYYLHSYVFNKMINGWSLDLSCGKHDNVKQVTIHMLQNLFLRIR